MDRNCLERNSLTVFDRREQPDVAVEILAVFPLTDHVFSDQPQPLTNGRQMRPDVRSRPQFVGQAGVQLIARVRLPVREHG